ncbi:unnamed protein product, partial [marine sediment metagenome]
MAQDIQQQQGVTFTTPGKPKTWKRRIVTRRGQSVNTNKPDQQWLAWAARRAGVKCYKGPMKVELKCFFKVPRHKAEGDYCAHKNVGDSDNLAKFLLDALNGVAYVDDGQVVELVVSKQYGVPRS